MKMPETEQLLCSLMAEIDNVQAFRSKWVVIRTKLADLPTQLRDLSEFSTTQLASELAHSISQTLSEALSLATKCLNPNPADGKLRTQSDIDSVAANLDQHIKDIGLLFKTGVLKESLVENGSGLVRVEAKNLITRLQMGNSESKNSAMDSLLGLFQEDDKNVLIAVAEGAVPVFVRLLESSCVEIKEKAVFFISRISVIDSCKHFLDTEGLFLINNLIRILDSRSGFAKEKACVALESLSCSKENARAIGSRGGIALVLGICQFGTPCSQAYAAGILRNLSVHSEIRQNLIQENAVLVLIGVLATGTFVTQEKAIRCLSNLVSDDERLKVLVAEEGGIECLTRFWDAAPMVQSLESAVGLLKNLATCRSISEALVSEGFIAKLVGLLNCGLVGMRTAVAEVICELAFSSKMRKQIGEAGVLSQLVRMLDAKAVEEKEMATRALSSLLLYPGNQRIFAKEEKGIEYIVQLLDPALQNLDRKYPVSALASIVNSKRCREQIVDAGACIHLQKLEEMEIDGAKKLLECLERNKIWGLFSKTK